jgi:hypothetical protein
LNGNNFIENLNFDFVLPISNKLKEDEMDRECSTNGDRRNPYRILVGKPERKRPLGRPGCRCVDNLKMDLREIGWDGMDWIYLAQDRNPWRALVKTVINFWGPQNPGKFLSSCIIGGFSRRAQLHE